ncbi:MAG: PhoPQ-activated protein PqaA family protein [Pirellulaceae bacterium]|nr:PhoPQ-activated protein PqaA family protein [Pirellulaceae bacterium]
MLVRTLGLYCVLLISCLGREALSQDRSSIPSSVEIPKQIFDYMARPEPDFDWKLAETTAPFGQKIYRIELTSQNWQNNVWKHSLVVYEPNELKHKDHMLLFVTGGNNGSVLQPKDLLMGSMLANFCGARVATLHQVPNQPLMDGRKEDDLITETWLKFLETKDATWPLLFPMVKSAVKAMDALESFSQDEFNQPLKGFVISGASKRGWTSWLAPVVDKRIIATAPMVIDMLNFPVQMKKQMENWGFYSEQIADYTSKGLVTDDGVPRSGPEGDLWKMMDPYTYRLQLSLPKLLVVGANDPYWNVDAMSHYWPTLVGAKHIMRVPNAGHSLDAGREHAMRTVGVFYRHAVASKSLPNLSWEPAVSEASVGLSLNSEPSPVESRLWVAASDDNDFRDSKWIAHPLTASPSGFSGSAVRSGKQRLAVFGEVDYEFEGLKYSLSTLVYWK